VLIGLICADYTNEVQTGLMNASWINQVLNQVLIAWSPGGLCWSPVVLVSMGLCLVSIVPAWSPGISLGLQGSLLVFSCFPKTFKASSIFFALLYQRLASSSFKMHRRTNWTAVCKLSSLVSLPSGPTRPPQAL